MNNLIYLNNIYYGMLHKPCIKLRQPCLFRHLCINTFSPLFEFGVETFEDLGLFF